MSSRGSQEDAAPPEAGEAQPFASSTEQLLAELSRIDLLIRMQAVRARAVAGDDAYRGLLISDTDAFALFDRPPGAPHWAAGPEQDALQARLNALAQTLAQRRELSLAAGVSLRLEQLAQHFALDRLDLDILLIGLAPEFDTRYERLFAYLQDDVTRKRPAVDLALALLCPTLPARLAARDRFLPRAGLLRHALLRLVSDPAQLQPTLLQQYFKVDDRIIDFLHGVDEVDTRLRFHARIIDQEMPLAEVVLPQALKDRLAALLRECPRVALHLQGPAGAGKKTLAAALCKSLGQRLLGFSATALLANAADGCEALIRLALREAKLLSAALFIEDFDALLSVDGKLARGLLLRELAQAEQRVFLAGESAFEPAAALEPLPFVRVVMPLPRTAERVSLWQRALPAELQKDAQLDLEALAGSYRLTGGQIRDATATAKGLCRLRGDGSSLHMSDLHEACHRRSVPELGSLAQKVKSSCGWDDLVLSADRTRRLHEIGIHARHRGLVFDKWGFERKLPTGRGLSVLFSGPPGTGKTLAASVIANDLGLDLYEIDLSAVVSKYIGETEKQLARVFAEAESSTAVLFFDEADALFGKRSETRDAHDRYANMEVAYLLQRMDSYEGVVILATNLLRNMDEAFMRRMRFIIDFPLPDEAERERIWDGILPVGVPKGADLDLRYLARRFELSGGYIRNIALAATFLAAEEGSVLSQRHLLRAARREYQKLGKLMDEGLFAEPH